MSETRSPAVDIEAAHKYFAAHCFNRTWELIEKKERTAEDDRLMVALNQASIYHWLQRPDCGNEQLSVGFWQASRIQSLLGNAVESRRQAEVCMSYSGDLAPFYLGYAHEAFARAAKIAGDTQLSKSHKDQAMRLAGDVGEKDDRELLLKDVEINLGLQRPSTDITATCLDRRKAVTICAMDDVEARSGVSWVPGLAGWHSVASDAKESS